MEKVVDGRVCNRCGEYKTWDNFYKKSGTKRYMAICKVCHSEDAKKHEKARRLRNKKPHIPIPFIDGELWADIDGSSRFQVSNHGRVKNKITDVLVRMSRQNKGDGLYMVGVMLDNKKTKKTTLGYLVAKYFVDNPNNYKHIRYLDKDFLNNQSSNIIYSEIKCDNAKPIRIDDTGRTCSMCMNFLPWDNFNTDITGVRAKCSTCKNCIALRYLDHADEMRFKANEYAKAHKKSIAIKSKIYSEAHKSERMAYSRRYTKERGAYKNLSRLNNPTKYELFKDKLTIDESPIEGENGELEVKCAFCGRYFKPSYNAAYDRVTGLNSDNGSENKLYCSDKCKKECPVFRTHEHMKGTKVYSTRQTNSVFRKMVLEADNYKCQMCGSEDNLEVHHIIPYSVNPMLDCDIDNAITLCHNCHREKHKTIDGCGYNDLKGCKR